MTPTNLHTYTVTRLDRDDRIIPPTCAICGESRENCQGIQPRPRNKDLMRQALDAWPDAVPLMSVAAPGRYPEARALGRTTDKQKVVLRAAGWQPGSPGWWRLLGKETA